MVVLSNFPPPTEGIKHQQPFTVAIVNNREVGKGTLFIAESRLAWVNSSTGQGFSVEYPNISMHAISRDLQAYEQECLYLMLDVKLEEVVSDDTANDDDSDGSNMTEMRFVPDDKGMLDAMFHALNECQVLHPDPNDSFSDEEEIYEDADEEGEYNLMDEAPRIDECGDRLNGRESDEAMETDGQFEDAEYESDH